jgi:dephospho-CoA kinase
MGGAIVVITGKIASGKTTLGRCLAERLAWPLVSFGDFVRSCARDAGAGEDRETLQNLYLAIVRDVGYERLTSSVLRDAGLAALASPLIVEGLRDIEIVEALRKEAGENRIIWLHVEPNHRERVRRASEKGISPDDLAAADRHSSEKDARAGVLKANADFVLSSGDATKVCLHAVKCLASAGVI